LLPLPPLRPLDNRLTLRRMKRLSQALFALVALSAGCIAWRAHGSPADHR
jgi:hypothetical protein